MISKIESMQNPKLLFWKKLKTKKYRDEHGLFLVYGDHLVKEAIKYQLVQTIISSDESLQADFYMSRQMMKQLCDLPSVPNIMAVVKKKAHQDFSSKRILALDGVQDPDNVGALLRSALAFGFNDIILSDQSADLYNDKTIRASQGALFALNIKRCNLIDALKNFKENRYLVIGADNKKTAYQKEKDAKIVLIMGSEGKGLSDDVKHLIDAYDTILTHGVESLNVSVAGAILMYEWSVIKWD